MIMKVPSSRASSIILLIVPVSSSSATVPGGYLELFWRVSSMDTVSGMYFPRAIWISAKIRRLKTGPGIGGSQAEAMTLSSCTRAGFSSLQAGIDLFQDRAARLLSGFRLLQVPGYLPNVEGSLIIRAWRELLCFCPSLEQLLAQFIFFRSHFFPHRFLL